MTTTTCFTTSDCAKDRAAVNAMDLNEVGDSPMPPFNVSQAVLSDVAYLPLGVRSFGEFEFQIELSTIDLNATRVAD